MGALKWVGDLFVCRVVVKEEAGRAVMAHVFQYGKKSPFGLRLFGGIGCFVQPKKRVEVVAYEGVSSEPLLFWFGRVPVLIGQGFSNHNDSTAPNVGSQVGDAFPVTIRFIRGTLKIDELLEQAVMAFNQKRQQTNDTKGVKRFAVIRCHGHSTITEKLEGKEIPRSASNAANTVQELQRGELRLLTWKPEELTERSSDQPPFDLYPFGEEALSILPEIETWISHERWFRSKGVPWRRGYLAWGPTGTGKSTFVRSIAIKHDLPLYLFDIASMDNQTLADNWRKVQQCGPAIVLLEDLDTVYKGREFIAATSKNRDTVTFDCLLNTISGVGSSDGILLFITTNHVDSLDSALGIPQNGKSSRPGRIDRTIHFGPMAEPQRRKLAEFILSDFPAEIDRMVTEGDGETAAQFQERCAQFAERAFWKDGIKGEVEPPPNRVKPEPEPYSLYLDGVKIAG